MVARISLREGVFRRVANGTETRFTDSDTLDVVIINAGRVSRIYYANQYDPDKPAAPVCWSSDTQRPDPDVPDNNKQSSRCIDCPHNIKGSGGNNARACKYSQRVAVVLEDNLEEVYQIQLPATSLFGPAGGGWMSMQNYARHLNGNNTSAINVVTRMGFEKDGYIPRLRFRPMRVLDGEETQTVAELETHPDTLQAITLVKGGNKVVSPFSEVEGFVFNPAN
tara:strand:+ start:126 stop:794 length:669 start_codon:yes stop_codon:yes gene_type:complete